MNSNNLRLTCIIAEVQFLFPNLGEPDVRQKLSELVDEMANIVDSDFPLLDNVIVSSATTLCMLATLVMSASADAGHMGVASAVKAIRERNYKEPAPPA